MDLSFLIIVLSWTAFLVYWKINSKMAIQTDGAITDKGDRYLLLAAAVAFFLSAVFGSTFPNNLLWLEYLSAVVVLAGAVIAIFAYRALTDNWSKQYQQGQKLITTGVYKYVRHPIYSGFLLMFLGTALYSENYLILVMFVILTIILISKIQAEDKLLIQQFQASYSRYKRRTKALFPYVW